MLSSLQLKRRRLVRYKCPVSRKLCDVQVRQHATEEEEPPVQQDRTDSSAARVSHVSGRCPQQETIPEQIQKPVDKKEGCYGFDDDFVHCKELQLSSPGEDLGENKCRKAEGKEELKIDKPVKMPSSILKLRIRDNIQTLMARSSAQMMTNINAQTPSLRC